MAIAAKIQQTRSDVRDSWRHSFAAHARRIGRDAVDASPRPGPPLPGDDGPVARFEEAVVARGEFTADWFTTKIEGLEAILAPLYASEARILEIGAYEGLSTCYFLWRLPSATVTCVDTFEGTPGMPSGGSPAVRGRLRPERRAH